MFIFEKLEKPIFYNGISSKLLKMQSAGYLPYAIRTSLDEKVIGYVFITLLKNDDLFVDYIEILDVFKNKGWGEKVVRAMFSVFKVATIKGFASIHAYAFWEKIGATLYMPTKGCVCDCSETVDFILKNPVENVFTGERYE